jgi:hypothetical protein
MICYLIFSVLIAAAAYGTSLLVTLFEGKLCPWKRTIENL